jgi:hypothetical protein
LGIVVDLQTQLEDLLHLRVMQEAVRWLLDRIDLATRVDQVAVPSQPLAGARKGVQAGAGLLRQVRRGDRQLDWRNFR